MTDPSQYRAQPAAGPLRATELLRATDLDRASVGALLDRAYAEGQLDTREHDQRIAAAMSAKTRGNLLVLLRDLQVEKPEFARDAGGAGGVPGVPGATAPGGPGAGHGPEHALVPSRNPSVVLVVIIVAVVTLVIVAAVTALAVFGSSTSSGSDSGSDPGVVREEPHDRVGNRVDDSSRNDRVGDAPCDGSRDGDTDRQPDVAPAVPAEDAGGSGEDAGTDAGTLKVSTYEMETSIRGDYLNSQDHVPDAVHCPDPLDVEVGASVECTVSDHRASFPTTVTVIGVQGSNVTYNVSIRGVY